MAHRTGGGRYRLREPWPATVGQESMNMSRWASAALARCSLEIDSLAYRGLPATPADGTAGAGVAKDPGAHPADRS
jgi:hypothetical protein